MKNTKKLLEFWKKEPETEEAESGTTAIAGSGNSIASLMSTMFDSLATDTLDAIPSANISFVESVGGSVMERLDTIQESLDILINKREGNEKL